MIITVKDLKEWVKTIPKKYDNFELLTFTTGEIVDEDKNLEWRYEVPVINFAIDHEGKKALIEVVSDSIPDPEAELDIDGHEIFKSD